MTTSKATKRLLKNIKLISHERSRDGINPHSTWIFEYVIRIRLHDKTTLIPIRAGIDRNHDVYGANYHCFSMRESTNGWLITSGAGEGWNTKWYNNLGLAKRQVARYLKSRIMVDRLCFDGRKKAEA